MKASFLLTGALGALILGGGVAIAQNDGAIMPDAPARAPMAMMGDANRDGNLTRAEMTAAAQAAFDRMDVNKDGKLDKADRDLKAKQRTDAFFDRADTDHNGQLSKAEFAAAHEARAQARAERRDKRMAMGNDAPPPAGDGADEAAPAHGPRHGMRGHGPGRWGRGGHAMGMMARMADTDKDGAISKAEFMAAATAHFDRADTNRDGVVTKTEMQAARAAMRARGPGDRPVPPPPPPPAGN